jgi:hypothetical protein
VQHGSVAEEKRETLGFVALRRIDTKLLCLLPNNLLNTGVDPAVSVQNAGGSCDTYVRSGCNFAEPYFALFGRNILLHALRGRLGATVLQTAMLLHDHPSVMPRREKSEPID